MRQDIRVIARTAIPGPSGHYRVEIDAKTIASDGVIRSARSDHNPELYSQLWFVRRQAAARG